MHAWDVPAVVLTLVYEKTDKLIAPILMHFLFNFVNFFAAIFAPEVNNFLRHFLHR